MSSNVRIEALTKRFAGKPPTVAMDHVDREIDEGEFLVLLGPSGCGKTTTLRCLGGLETPDEGRISFGDRVVYDSGANRNLSPDKRNIGMVFQSYALWPHMTVRKNIGYPLRARKLKGPETATWVEDTAKLVDTDHLLDRYPGQLSGGQQQRVALARGLVARPDLVLFDEPLSNLDARLRDSVRAQLHELHIRLRYTAVFVTHDQTEALALGNRMAIMRAGAIEQLATPEEIFEEPATDYVADFIGMSNRVTLERREGGWSFDGVAVEGRLPVPSAHGTVGVRIRPDDVLVLPPDQQHAPGVVSFPGEVVDSEFGGRHMDVVVVAQGHRLLARLPSGAPRGWTRTLEPGQPVTVGFAEDTAIYFGADDVRIAGHVPVETSAPVGA